MFTNKEYKMLLCGMKMYRQAFEHLPLVAVFDEQLSRDLNKVGPDLKSQIDIVVKKLEVKCGS
jgi:hypothetical protein